MEPLNLPFHSYRRAGNRGQRLVNVFAEQSDMSGEQVITLYAHPGIETLGEMPQAGCRGVLRGKFAGRRWVVRGRQLFGLADDNSFIMPGRIEGTGRVSLATDGRSLMIVANPDAYVYDGVTLSRVTAGDFVAWGSRDCVEMDGFMLHVAARSKQVFFKSKLYASDEYEATDFDLKSKYSDEAIGILAADNQLFVFGERSLELWYNSGASPFPYARVPNGTIEIGLAATHAKCKTERSVYFLGSDRIVYRINTGSFMPEPISDHAVAEAMQGYADVSDAWSATMEFSGHTMVLFVFPSAGRCWVFSENFPMWSERQSYGMTGVDIGGVVDDLAFQAAGAKFGRFKSDCVTEFDRPLVSSWTYANVYAGNRLVSHARLEVNIDTGLPPNHGAPLRMMLDISDDGGETFRPFPAKDCGSRGQYGQRVVFSRLGAARNRVYRNAVVGMGRAAVRDAQLFAKGARL